MKVYVVTYKGLYMGGKATVIANSAEEAKALVETAPKTVNFEDVNVIEFGVRRPCVIFNENGDY